MRACLTIAFSLFIVVLGMDVMDAASYPSRRINLIVPFPAGSATDAVTRRLAESIGTATNATVMVENKPGADGNLAALSVLKAEADGYTVFVTTNSTQAANVNLFNSMPYDPARDFAPVAGIMTIPMMPPASTAAVVRLLGHAGNPFRSRSEQRQPRREVPRHRGGRDHGSQVLQGGGRHRHSRRVVVDQRRDPSR